MEKKVNQYNLRMLEKLYLNELLQKIKNINLQINVYIKILIKYKWK
jgi:hypothetical protein